MRTPTLFFLRHGETDWNLEGRLQGQRDIPLNDVGRVQAEEAGRRLGGLLSHPEDLPWLVSPMTRTRETAEIAREALGLHPPFYTLEDRLKELTFGSWEGLTWPEVEQSDPSGAKARERDKWSFVPPGGESYAMLTDRIAGWLATVHQDSIIISHGGVARALMVLLAGSPRGKAPLSDIHQGKVLMFEKGGFRWA